MSEDQQAESVSDEKKLILNFIAGLHLCDHMGDVSGDVDTLLRKLGMQDLLDRAEERDDYFLPAVSRELEKLGCTTMYGGQLFDEPEVAP